LWVVRMTCLSYSFARATIRLSSATHNLGFSQVSIFSIENAGVSGLMNSVM
jgi:hypothetical protein